jgi:hypothetical protein
MSHYARFLGFFKGDLNISSLAPRVFLGRKFATVIGGDRAGAE